MKEGAQVMLIAAKIAAAIEYGKINRRMIGLPI
jgi:hypothetical protein